MSELVKRTLSGAVFVGCIIGSILWNQWAIAGLILLVSLLAVDEFHRLVHSYIIPRICAALGTIVIWCMFVCIAYHPGNNDGGNGFALAFGAVYLPIIVLSLLDEIWNHSGNTVQNWGNMLISQFMIAFPLLSMLFMYSLDKWLLLALFVLIWVNDTAAYCVGSFTAKRPQGNHKMTPHISPKKSWEGLFGGFAFSILTAFILNWFGWFDAIASGEGHANGWMVLLIGFFTSGFGTMGDLMESLFKRTIGVKDSGFFLPGHGGVLDRFDSILLAAPIMTAFCWICYFIAPLL
jgi:phosphatidate cytidylyltransferase